MLCISFHLFFTWSHEASNTIIVILKLRHRKTKNLNNMSYLGDCVLNISARVSSPIGLLTRKACAFRNKYITTCLDLCLVTFLQLRSTHLAFKTRVLPLWADSCTQNRLYSLITCKYLCSLHVASTATSQPLVCSPHEFLKDRHWGIVSSTWCSRGSLFN